LGFNINSFRANGLRLGGARPTQFEVNLFPPFASEATKQVRMLVNAASLPSFLVQPAVAPYFGAQIKYAGERVYDNWQCEVLNDEDFAIRALLEKWSNETNALISNRMNPELWPTGYKGTAEVTQFGKDGRALRIYRFVGLWPMQLGSINLAWDAVAQIERFDCTFCLDYYEPIDQNSSPDAYNPVLPDDGQVSGNPGVPVV
jgi:hypothetical protein